MHQSVFVGYLIANTAVCSTMYLQDSATTAILSTVEVHKNPNVFSVLMAEFTYQLNWFRLKENN